MNAAPADSLPAPRRAGALPTAEVAAAVFISAAMVLATARQAWSIGWTETLGFVTGGLCVWLVVREHLWNWPLGLANNVVLFVLFSRGRLYADAWLQVAYFVIGIYGWWNWLHGGAQRAELAISRAPRLELLAVLAGIPLAAAAMWAALVAAGGAAPFWDALTTALSLAAQFLVCRKRLEHWLFWIVADVIYVPLCLARDLPLIAMLYGLFLLLCLAGWRQWHARWKSSVAEAPT